MLAQLPPNIWQKLSEYLDGKTKFFRVTGAEFDTFLNVHRGCPKGRSYYGSLGEATSPQSQTGGSQNKFELECV